MKRTAILFLVLMATFACKEKSKEKNEIATEMEKETPKEMEWVTLFDGTSFKGWHGYNATDLGDTWKLEDGAMVFYPPENRPAGESYNIITDGEYTDFILSLEWNVSENGNSGIFWGVFEDAKYRQPYETGPEIQVLDDAGHPDAKNGTSHQAGALYDMVAPSQKVVKPAGEWNSCVLTVNHTINEGNVVLNGVEIAKFPVHGALWDEMVADSKFATWDGFGKYRTGKIGLQDHGDVVAYRNIRIKKL